MTTATATATKAEVQREFEAVKREVVELGKSGLTRKERKRVEEERLAKLGFARKKMKVPLPILAGMQRKQRLREAAKAVAERDAGIVSSGVSASLSSSIAAKRKRPSAEQLDKWRKSAARAKRSGDSTGVYRMRDATRERRSHP